MSKERLEEIKRKATEHNEGYFNQGYGRPSLDDVLWLIKQAERVEELEQQLNKQVENGYLMEGKYHDEVDKNKRLEKEIVFVNERRLKHKQENKRYHEAIKKAIAEFNQDEHHHGMNELIRALEGEE